MGMNNQGATNFPGIVRRILAHKAAGPVVTTIAVLSRIIQLVFFYNLRVDASYQVMATRNLVNGHGITIARVMGSDLSHVVYEPLINWPPGYSLLLAPFYFLGNGNYILAALTLDVLAALLLIYVTRKLLRLLHVPDHLVNSFTFISGFFVYYFYFIASSDAIAISLFMAALYSYFRLRTGGHSLKHTFFLGMALLLCGSIKYLFLPVIFIPPVLLMAEGFLSGKTSLKKAASISFFMVLAGMVALLLFQKMEAGSAAYISEPGRGFFPEHLLKAYPFIPAAFLKPDTIGLFFNSNANTGSSIYQVFQVVHVLLALFLFIYGYRFNKRSEIKPLSSAMYFGLMTVLVSLALTLLLAFLSLRVVEEQILPGFFWTYIEEARYFGLPVVMIQMCAFIFFRQRQRGRIIFYGLVLLLLIEAGRGGFFDMNRVSRLSKEEYSWQRDLKFQKYADLVLRKAALAHPGVQQVVTGSAAYMSNRVSIFSGLPVINEPERLEALQHPTTTQPVLILVILPSPVIPGMQEVISRPGVQFAGKFDDYSLYTYYVDARRP